jgi:large subunit ribosomal protein L28
LKINYNIRGSNKKKAINKMSKICQITGKKAMVGNNVSHSNRRTKRKFDVNLFTKKFYWVEQDCWVSLNISANGLRTINKVGLDTAIKQAVEKGFINV